MFRDCFHLPWNGANIERSLILSLDELQLGPIVDDHDRVALLCCKPVFRTVIAYRSIDRWRYAGEKLSVNKKNQIKSNSCSFLLDGQFLT